MNNPANGCNAPLFTDLALGPVHKFKRMSKYFINGYKFHTEEWSMGKKTYNCGVSVNAGSDEQFDYYGVIQEILEVEYQSWPT